MEAPGTRQTRRRDLQEFRGRPYRECQDCSSFNLVSPRSAKIAARFDLVSPSLRLGLTLCHRDLPADQADYSPESCQFAARIDFVSPRPARGIDGITGI
ncbi:hypothetical protein Prudu_022066 [Prunus dulcis]|uniref:Uncharacterized protein n=1 Tax=Prunus dulcis TaxID=3755 RepID=A0A4Y1RZW0_PRUDU|nr:hypothetical protein Prudu_022066 [Prunus dulcis]